MELASTNNSPAPNRWSEGPKNLPQTKVQRIDKKFENELT